MTSVKRLIVQKMAVDAVPSGGGFNEAIKWLVDPEAIRKSARDAAEWANEAIRAVRRIPHTVEEPNPFRTATDEEIAAEIMRGVDERDRKRAAK